MSSPFRIELAREEDMAAITQIIIPSFESIPLEAMMGNVDTPEGHQAAGARHIKAWHDHATESAIPCAIKCIHTDPSTREEKIVGYAEWFIFDKPRSAEQAAKDNYLVSASWLPTENGERDRIKAMIAPIVSTRRKWMGARPHALFMYMAVDKAWRRRGASTLCVQWGLDKCKELGIPAYLEASEEGEPVYKRLGFVEVEKVEVDMGVAKGAFPAMIWWPEGMGEGERRPVGEVVKG